MGAPLPSAKCDKSDDVVEQIDHDDHMIGSGSKRCRKARPSKACGINRPTERATLSQRNIVVNKFHEQLDQAIKIGRIGGRMVAMDSGPLRGPVIGKQDATGRRRLNWEESLGQVLA
jgi:hypothetical protein